MKPSKEVQLVLGLINLNSKVQKKLGGALSLHGLGVSEFLVLKQLQGAPNETMRRVDLAEQVGLSASGVTRLLNPMEKMGLVQKDASARDARVSLVGLSKGGKRTLSEAEDTINAAAKAVLKPLNAQQLRNLNDLLQTLV